MGHAGSERRESVLRRSGKEFLVDTSPTKRVVVSGITRDATTEACIFDLIDNSVDAARNTLVQELPAKSRKEIPDSFFGFKIKLSLSANGFKIEDNCGGISVDQLKGLVMKFGGVSDQKMGIGAFGLGLNRALFRLGKVSHFKTDTGKQRAELILNTEDYLDKPDNQWELPAEEFQSTGEIGTTIEIRQLADEPARLFADDPWKNAFARQIGRRYGRFIAKKLAIWVGNIPVQNEDVQIRENGPYEPISKLYKTEDGVVIQIEYGQHINHRFRFEPGYDQAQNRRLTAQYGWTVYCNDRAVLLSDKTITTGWDTKFHSEFYGFVGNINFIHADPSKLPWDTTKTRIDLNNPAYQKALSDMRHFAKEWRAVQFRRLKGKGRGEQYRPIPPKPAEPVPTPSRKSKRADKAAPPPPRVDHNEFRTVLPPDINEVHCLDKHLALVREAKGLDIVSTPYSGLALIRMLFESSVVTFMDRHNRYAELKQFAIDRRSKKISMTDDEKNRLIPNMDEMLAWLANNPGIWGAAKQNYLKHNVSKMSGHQKTMNTVLHNPYQLTNRTQAIVIRDEVLPLLRHFIEK
jgi:Histidine kinase-, DNA gyrase B-, and HSP90-like ATPase